MPVVPPSWCAGVAGPQLSGFVYPEAFSPHRIGSSASVQLKREQFMSAPSHNPGVFPLHAPQVEEVNSPRYSCVHELLEAAAQGRPESIAVEFEGRSLTYAELHARANQLARVLRRRAGSRISENRL